MGGGAVHRLAWEGLACEVPATWNLAGYSRSGRLVSLTLEDDYTQRAQLQWVPLKRTPDAARVRAQFARQERAFARQVVRQEPLAELPEGWSATLYELADGHRVVAGYGLLRRPECLVFVVLRFGPADEEVPGVLARRLARSVAMQTGPVREWAVYDLVCALPARWSLAETVFEAGRKRLTFQWRLRRVVWWQFSLAGLLLRETAPATWCAGFLNGSRLLPGRRCEANGDQVTARWLRRYPLHHWEELGRWCFQYRIDWHHDPAADRLWLRVAQFRRPADLADLPPLG
jgi:hypothetical protein